MPTKRKCECTRCFYCNMPLAPKHEHDHFPIPKNLGGDETVPTCWNCHTLKDRIPKENWPMDAFEQVIGEMQNAPPLLKIWLASTIRLVAESNAILKASNAAAEAGGPLCWACLENPVLEETITS